jgi:HAE1 family hydrophobic/amphiphilic exporter-1
VEVARAERAQGRPPEAAAVMAARARFRPILMTSIAFSAGVAPLVLSTGAGAAARISLGLAVLSGMVASTCLAVLFVPPIFVVLERGVQGATRPLDTRDLTKTIELEGGP